MNTTEISYPEKDKASADPNLKKFKDSEANEIKTKYNVLRNAFELSRKTYTGVADEAALVLLTATIGTKAKIVADKSIRELKELPATELANWELIGYYEAQDIPFNGNRAIKSLPVVGQNNGGTTLKEWAEKTFFKAIDATVSLTGTLTEIFERGITSGDAGSRININANIVVNDATNVKWRIYDNTAAAGVGSYVNLSEFPSPISSAAPFTTNTDKDWKVQIQYDMDGVTKTLLSANTEQHRFVVPYFIGMSAADITTFTSEALQAMGLSKVIASIGSQIIRTFNGVDKRIYILVPTTKGPITSIIDQNNFNVTSLFTMVEAEITSGTPAWAQNFRIYKSGLTTVPNADFKINF